MFLWRDSRRRWSGHGGGIPLGLDVLLRPLECCRPSAVACPDVAPGLWVPVAAAWVKAGASWLEVSLQTVKPSSAWIPVDPGAPVLAASAAVSWVGGCRLGRVMAWVCAQCPCPVFHHVAVSPLVGVFCRLSVCRRACVRLGQIWVVGWGALNWWWCVIGGGVGMRPWCWFICRWRGWGGGGSPHRSCNRTFCRSGSL